MAAFIWIRKQYEKKKYSSGNIKTKMSEILQPEVFLPDLSLTEYDFIQYTRKNSSMIFISSTKIRQLRTDIVA